MKKSFFAAMAAAALAFAVAGANAAEQAASGGWGIGVNVGNTFFLAHSDITPGSAEALDKLAKENPKIRTLMLAISGGSVDEAIKVAEVVRKYQLNTIVMLHCYDACVGVFAAGQSRVMSMKSEMNIAPFEKEEDNLKMKEHLVSSGVSQEFIEKAWNVPKGMYYTPDAEDLYVSNIVTELAASESTTLLLGKEPHKVLVRTFIDLDNRDKR